MDYYRILGINKDASNEDIKKAYRGLAKVYHPDLNKADNAAYIFMQIKEAYDVLSDPLSRRAYDYKMGFKNVSDPFTGNYSEQYTSQSYSETKENSKGKNEDQYSSSNYNNNKSEANETRNWNTTSGYSDYGKRSSGSQEVGTEELKDMRDWRSRIYASLLIPLIIFFMMLILALFTDPSYLLDTDLVLVLQVYLLLSVFIFFMLTFTHLYDYLKVKFLYWLRLKKRI